MRLSLTLSQIRWWIDRGYSTGDTAPDSPMLLRPYLSW